MVPFKQNKTPKRLVLLPHGKEVIGLIPGQLGPFCVEFAYFPSFWMGFLWSPLSTQNTQMCAGTSNLCSGSGDWELQSPTADLNFRSHKKIHLERLCSDLEALVDLRF